MSDDEDELHSEIPLDMGFDGHDMMGFGPLLPTESERSLMERVRQELKIELKQVTNITDHLKFHSCTDFYPDELGIFVCIHGWFRVLGRGSKM